MRLLAFLLIAIGTIGAAIGVARTDPSVEGFVKSFQWHVPLTLVCPWPCLGRASW